MKRLSLSPFLCSALLLIMALFFQLDLSAQASALDVVVIDAGHGGKDGGCHGIKAWEKNVNLSIALKLGELITSQYPGIKVIYTRSTDVFIPLDERAQIANSNKADLFISIHCNAVPTNKENVSGTETYTMGMHVKDANLAVAQRENEAIFYEDNYTEKYEGFDPNSPQAYILLNMYQNAHIEQSLRFAEKVEKEFGVSKRKSKGVYQAGFLVLRKTIMPSVLIETGFLTNPTEEVFMASDAGQDKLAGAIFNAFTAYHDDVVGTQTVAAKATPKKKKKVMADTTDVSQPGKQTKMKIIQPVDTTEQEAAPAKPTAATAKPAAAAAKPQLKIIPTKINYAVQLCSSATPANVKATNLSKVDDLVTERNGNFYTYLSPKYDTYKEAQEALTYWRQHGFADAILVAYKNNKRVPLSSVTRT